MTYLLWAAMFVVGCSAVRVDPAAGGSAGEGGMGGSPGGMGAAGGGGETSAGPVPGCEQLAMVDQAAVYVGANVGDVRVIALDGSRAGYIFTSAQDRRLFSQLLSQLFDSWPPVLDDMHDHVQELADPVTLGAVSGRADGAFAVWPFAGLFDVDDGYKRIFNAADRFQGFMAPPPSVAVALVVSADSETYVWRQLSSLGGDSLLPERTFAAAGCLTMRAAFDSDDTVLFSSAPDAACGGAAHVDFHRGDANGLTVSSGFELPFVPHAQELAKHAGGYWYFIASPEEGGGTVVYDLDENAVVVGEAYRSENTYGTFVPAFLPWRDGFVLTDRTMNGVSLRVVSGQYTTIMAPAQLAIGNTQVALAVGGENDRSILVGYPSNGDGMLARVDCASAIASP